MKATLELPDDLYRRIKARSAMEGRPVRSVAVELFQKWLDAPAEPTAGVQDNVDLEASPWLAITRPYVRKDISHDMESIRASIAKGWAAEAAEKLKSSTAPGS